jgi:hypothetical protein
MTYKPQKTNASLQLNQVIMVGYVSRDPILVEPKPPRMPFIKLILGVGVRVSKTYEFIDFHHVAIFPAKVIDLITKYVRKGDHVFVQGVLRQRARMTQAGRYIMTARVEVYSGTGRLILMGIPKLFSEDVRIMRAKMEAASISPEERQELAASICHAVDEMSAHNIVEEIKEPFTE